MTLRFRFVLTAALLPLLVCDFSLAEVTLSETTIQTGDTSSRLETDKISAAFESRREAFTACYEGQPPRRRKRKTKRTSSSPAHKSGTVLVIVNVGSKGIVDRAEVKSTTLNDAAVESCVLDVVKKIKFPPPPPGAVVYEMEYPFSFKPLKL